MANRGRLRRVLFLCEAVSFSQVVRSLVLARSLDPQRFEPHLACGSYDRSLLGDPGVALWPLHSVPKADIDQALQSGARLYDEATLERYVEADLELIARVRPDLIVGDFRLSLPISAARAKLPLVTLINAYWSPHAVRPMPLPEHPIVRLLGVELAARTYPLAIPAVLRHFAAPVNAVRRRFGLPAIGDLRQVLVHGDLTLFPDVPSLVPLRGAPAHHHFIGPLTWSPPLPAPPAPGDGPLVYVTLGSTGRPELLQDVLAALGALPVRVAASTAGHPPPKGVPPNVQLAPMLPGDLIARRAALVVCNGGASTAYQALAAGRPVLGLPYNLDQYLAMGGIAAAGAGLQVRSGQADPATLGAALRRLLDEGAYATAAQRLAAEFAQHDARRRFAELVA